MDSFPATLARLRLGEGTPATLDQQTGNERSLKQDGQGDHGQLPTVLLPHGRGAKMNFASRRQIGFADVPALQLSPIEFRCSGFYGRRLDVARRLSVQNAYGDIGGALRGIVHRYDRTADHPFAEKDINTGENGCIGNGTKTGKCLVTFVRAARGVHVHGNIQDGRLWWQGRGAFQHFIERQSLNHVNAIRSVKGWKASRNCPTQYFSIGEFPRTTAMPVVSGSTRKMFLRARHNRPRSRPRCHSDPELREEFCAVPRRRTAWASKERAEVYAAERTLPPGRQWPGSDRAGVWQKEPEGIRQTGPRLDPHRNAPS